jgi:hypothetical protein
MPPAAIPSNLYRVLKVYQEVIWEASSGGAQKEKPTPGKKKPDILEF